MTRRLMLAATALIGAALGAGATATVQDRDDATTAGPTQPPPAPAPVVTVERVLPVSGEQLLLAWTDGGLLDPDGLVAAALAVPGVTTATVVHGDPVALASTADDEGKVVVAPVDATPGDGWIVALDAIAVDPAGYTGVVAAADRTAVAGLRPGEALLGETSARLRGVGPGATLHLGPATGAPAALTIADVVPDEAIGGAELAVDLATGVALGITTPRALIVVHEGDRAAVEAALTAALPPSTPVRYRAVGETPFLRAGDAVLPPALIKDAFGELAYRIIDPASRDVEVDPAWVEANIASATVPLLGVVRCHRAILPALLGAMTELSQKNLAGAVVSYDGCWVPRLVGPGLPLSRHAWGAAIDLNYAANTTGTGSTQDPRLVEVMERWGFAWGGRWLDPDPAHFEFVSPAPGSRR